MIKGNRIISPFQQELLKIISEISDSEHFYLTGGTALAEFYLEHRYSYDIDLFTSDIKLIVPFSRSYENHIRSDEYRDISLKIIRRYESFVEYEVIQDTESVRIQFALDSPFQFQKPERSEYGIKVNSLIDLATDKLLAFFSRAEPRDAMDLYFLLNIIKLDELIQRAQEKDPGFDLYWFGIALMKVEEFPDEISRWPVKMIKSVEGSDIKNMFISLSKDLMGKIKNK